MVENHDLQSDFSDVLSELPLLPIRDLVVFPFMVVPLFVGRELSVAAIDKAVEGERLLFLCAQKNAGADEPSANELELFLCT